MYYIKWVSGLVFIKRWCCNATLQFSDPQAHLRVHYHSSEGACSIYWCKCWVTMGGLYIYCNLSPPREGTEWATSRKGDRGPMLPQGLWPAASGGLLCQAKEEPTICSAHTRASYGERPHFQSQYGHQPHIALLRCQSIHMVYVATIYAFWSSD